MRSLCPKPAASKANTDAHERPHTRLWRCRDAVPESSGAMQDKSATSVNNPLNTSVETGGHAAATDPNRLDQFHGGQTMPKVQT